MSLTYKAIKVQVIFSYLNLYFNQCQANPV